MSEEKNRFNLGDIKPVDFVSLYESSEEEGVTEAAETLINVSQELREEYEKSLEQMEKDIVDLSFEIAAKIIQAELATKPDLVINAVKASFERLKSSNLTLRLNPEDVEIIEKAFQKKRLILPETAKLTIVEDEGIERGGCILSSDQGTVNGQPSIKLELMKEKVIGPKITVKRERSEGEKVNPPVSFEEFLAMFSDAKEVGADLNDPEVQARRNLYELACLEWLQIQERIDLGKKQRELRIRGIRTSSIPANLYEELRIDSNPNNFFQEYLRSRERFLISKGITEKLIEELTDYQPDQIQKGNWRKLLFEDFIAHFDRQGRSWEIADRSEEDIKELDDQQYSEEIETIKEGKKLFEPFYQAFMELKELYPVEEWVWLVDELEEAAINQPDQLSAKVKELKDKSSREEVKEDSSEEKDQKEKAFDPETLINELGDYFGDREQFNQFVAIYFQKRGGEREKLGRKFLNLIPSDIIGAIPEDISEEGDQRYIVNYLEIIIKLYIDFLTKRNPEKVVLFPLYLLNK